LATVPMGESLKVIGRGRNTGMTHDPVLTPTQLAQLTVSADREPFDGDARMFRLGIEAQRLGLAYEYDPFFSLSIARVDPLPHQLEAVYSYFMKLPRIRFLLADDPGAGRQRRAVQESGPRSDRGSPRHVGTFSRAARDFDLVWSKNSCGLFVVIFQQTTQSFPSINGLDPKAFLPCQRPQ